MKRKLTLAAASLIILILALIWIQGGFHSKTGPGRTEPPAKQGPATKTGKVEIVRSGGAVTVSGTVAARELARVASRILGYVLELNVHEGDKVTKDQLLLRIDTKEVAEKLDQAKANLESANADFIKARNDYERYKVLYEKQSVAKKDYDDALARYEVAKAVENRAEAAVEEAKTTLEYGKVTAPYDGIVSERTVNVGDLATPGKALLSIYVPGTLELVAPVGEQYANYLSPGTPAEVSVPSLNLVQKSAIREVVPQREERTRTITVKVPLTEAPDLAPGLYGTLTFNTRPSDVLAIPVTALKTVGQLEFVQALEKGAPVTRHVKTGRKIDGDRIEIISGLSAGEEVVIP
jgi:membrane fusion protein, multidrug efflux system